MKLKRRSEIEAVSFDLTPMIDVVLLLIIFFMFTSHFARTHLRPMDLPRTKGEERLSAEAPKDLSLVIDIDREGTMTILGAPTSIDGLRRALKDAGVIEGNRSLLEVTVRADRQCSAARVNDVVKELGAAGIRRWRLATAGPESVGG